MGDDPKFSQEELASILQEAAEREAREGPRSFTATDLVQAGREMGLSPGTIEAVARERLVRERAAAEVVPRPFDTRIRLEATGDRFLLVVPPRGLHGPAVAKLAASAFMLACVAFWISGAVRVGAPRMFTLFGAVFAAVAAGVGGGAILSMITGHRLELGREGGRLETTPLGRSRAIRPDHLTARLDVLRKAHDHHQGGRRVEEIPVLALDHGRKTFHLLARFSEQERRWVKAELDAWLGRG
jgi:hypothetical protein